MIAHLTGVLEEKTPEQLIVDVQGVGYQVFVSLQTFYAYLPCMNEYLCIFIRTSVRMPYCFTAFWRERESLFSPPQRCHGDWSAAGAQHPLWHSC